jgi:hypothetical protein
MVPLGHEGGWDETLIGLGALGLIIVVYVIGLRVWTARQRSGDSTPPSDD